MSHPRLRDQSGQTMAEYGVILAIITASVLSALLLFSAAIRSAIMTAVAIITGS